MCHPAVDEAIVLASGAVARLIPARQDNFPGATIQPRLRRAEEWIERAAGAARPSRHPGALLASFLLGIGRSPEGEPFGSGPLMIRTLAACHGEVPHAPEPLVTLLGLTPGLVVQERA